MVREKPYKNKKQKLEKNLKEQGEKMKNKFRFPLNIQCFAEEPTDGEPNPSSGSKTYSEEEYNQLLAELEKQKSLKDKYSSEIADYKKKEKEKMTDDQKKDMQQKELIEKLDLVQKELRMTKMSKEFISVGFNEEATKNIIESYEKNREDPIEFTKMLCASIKKFIDSVRLEEQQKFNQNTPLPPNGGNTGEKTDPLLQSIIDLKKGNGNSARDYYLGNKK